MITETDYAWAAGIIDGEGCLHVRKQFRTKSKRYSYTPYIQVAMSHLPTMERFGYILPGKIRKCHRIVNKRLVFWVPNNTIESLNKVLPYLVTKKEEALLIIEMENLPKRTKTTDEEVDRKRLIYEEVKYLKKIDFNKEIEEKYSKEHIESQNEMVKCPHCENMMKKYQFFCNRLRTGCSDRCTQRAKKLLKKGL